jgi:hypothetical protein
MTDGPANMLGAVRLSRPIPAQAFCAGLCWFVWVAIYNAAEYFSYLFRSLTGTTFLVELGLFCLFSAGLAIFKGLAKAFGRLVDTGKRGSNFSFYFAFEVLSRFFYYAFYRLLFEAEKQRALCGTTSRARAGGVDRLPSPHHGGLLYEYHLRQKALA